MIKFGISRIPNIQIRRQSVNSKKLKMMQLFKENMIKKW